jgi:SAM-dependent methyltransferase
VDRDYGQSYERLYREHWWWRSREEFLLKVIQSLKLPTKSNILDIGCGDGLFLDRLSEFGGIIEGLESDSSLISRDSANRHRIHIGPFDRTFKPNKQYGLILMLDVLEHLPEPEAALKHAVELLDSDGLVVITVPAFPCLWTTHDDINHHYVRYTKQSLKRLATSASLRVDLMRYFFHWLFPLKLAIRFKEMLILTHPTPPKIPTPSVNRAMLAISRLEQRICDRYPFPLGSSLLAVGSRQELPSK